MSNNIYRIESFHPWILNASEGDLVLARLMTARDQLYSEVATTEREAPSREQRYRGAFLAHTICERQIELGIDPLYSPQFPKDVADSGR